MYFCVPLWEKPWGGLCLSVPLHSFCSCENKSYYSTCLWRKKDGSATIKQRKLNDEKHDKWCVNSGVKWWRRGGETIPIVYTDVHSRDRIKKMRGQFEGEGKIQWQLRHVLCERYCRKLSWNHAFILPAMLGLPVMSSACGFNEHVQHIIFYWMNHMCFNIYKSE